MDAALSTTERERRRLIETQDALKAAEEEGKEAQARNDRVLAAERAKRDGLLVELNRAGSFGLGFSLLQ